MDHEVGIQLAGPEERAVVAAYRDELVEHRPLRAFEGPAAEGLEHAAARGHGHLRHGTVPRLREKLREVRRPGELVFGLGIVVRAVVGMAPIVQTVGDRLDEDRRSDESFAQRPQNAEQLFFGHALLGFAADCHDVGQVVCQMDAGIITLPDVDTAVQQPRRVGGTAGGFHVVLVGELYVNHQLAGLRQPDGQVGPRIPEDCANASGRVERVEDRLHLRFRVRCVCHRGRDGPGGHHAQQSHDHLPCD